MDLPVIPTWGQNKEGMELGLGTKSNRSHSVFCILQYLCAVTVSSAGPGKLFKGLTTATSGVLARFPLLLPVRNSFASYGASAVPRTSDRGHVAEARNQGHQSGGVSIRVSKEILLPLNVHLCSVSSTKMLKTIH